MTSNTKLATYEKTRRKALLAEAAKVGGFTFAFANFGVTVAIVPKFDGSNFSNVAISIASPDEKKFRRKVGEYHALNRWIYGVYVTVPTPTHPHAFASQFARLVAGFDVAPTVDENEYRYDANGFGRDGFDCDGFDRDDFDRDGFDRDGFDRDGFGRDGFDCDGFDRDGFSRDGFGRKYGFSRDGNPA